MKALTFKEPCATLVAKGIKTVEVKGRNTKHRGDLVIHAGKSINKETLRDYGHVVDKSDFKPGRIVAKCNLVDSVLITKEFVKEYNDNSPIYKLDESEIGKYAWILEDITPLFNQNQIKGKLNFWEIEEELVK